ncbi:MAG: hypothetical protein ABR563_11665, partial [Pyrinomonadaceae bacterium]
MSANEEKPAVVAQPTDDELRRLIAGAADAVRRGAQEAASGSDVRDQGAERALAGRGACERRRR